jgi:hypothetical protein
MAEDKPAEREYNVRQMFPWTELFRGFQVALDPRKLLLAAAGILAMALSWWVLAWVFFGLRDKPEWVHYAKSGDDATEAWSKFRSARDQWNILLWAAGPGPEAQDAGDLAGNAADFDALTADKDQLDQLDRIREEMKQTGQVQRTVRLGGKDLTVSLKAAGALRTLPWEENRGVNPYLLVTGQAGIPRQAGALSSWFLTEQLPVLIEPLRKLVAPVVGLLRPGNGTYNSCYFLLVIVVTLAVWGFFGGAITRMASVQIARNEKIGMREAMRFVCNRYVSFLSAPLFPLLFVAFMVVLLCLFGIVFLIPWLGDIFVAGFGWPLVLLAGLVMAVVLVGLVGWPMMYATISTEGSDAFDAISRSYSYVYQSPWNYAWYGAVAVVYGAVVVFFVGFMGSMIVYLGKWGVSQTPFIQMAGRDPSFLFAYAPHSFGWRNLLLDGAQVGGQSVVQNGQINPDAYSKYTGADANYTGTDQMSWANQAGAFLVSIWLYLFFLMILGFGYSYFWCASTIIYLLMRRKVDDTDLDEVFLEEDEGEEPYPAGAGAPVTSAAAPAPATGAAVNLVEPPALRPPPSPSPPMEAPSPAESSAPASSSSDRGELPPDGPPPS